MKEPTLGEYLRNTRETKGITVDQVASATKISVRIIHLLEDDRYEDLPAKPFVRGFVSSYAKFIGADTKEILVRYFDFLEEKAKERPQNDSGHKGYVFEKKEKTKPYLWITMGVLVVLGGAGLFLLKPALKKKQVSHLEILQKTPEETVPAVTDPAAVVNADDAEIDAAAHEEESAVGAIDANKVEAVAAEEVKTVAVEEKIKAEEKLKLEKELAEKQAAEKLEAEKQAKEKELAEKKAAEKLAAENEEKASKTNQSAEPNREPAPDDPLNKGDMLKPEQIKYRAVFKALEDVWVRYQTDSRPMMRFILQKDKTLVLRATDLIKIQVSNPSALLFRTGTFGFKPLKEEKFVAMHDYNASVIIPNKNSTHTESPFSSQGLLPKTPDPQ